MLDFIFKSYQYDDASKQARFSYQNGPGLTFTETITFNQAKKDYNKAALERAMFLAFILIGTSYYKTFPSPKVKLEVGGLDEWQVSFFNAVYQEGLSQFAFDNNLKRDDLAHFDVAGTPLPLSDYIASDIKPLVLQSGGKDSLLLATILKEKGVDFDTWFLQNGPVAPDVLSQAGNLITATRQIDRENLEKASEAGGLNGHVPVTYLVLSIALLQSVLLGKNTIIAAIGHEGEEPYDYIGDMPVAHQWAKTWAAEQQFNTYTQKYVSQALQVGSSLRRYSELKIAKLFVEKCWKVYSRSFSSCNIGNYKLGHDNQKLGWCGNCPKCANSFLLFAPFVEPEELLSVFNGENLFNKASLSDTFKGLLGIDGVAKPFECIGEEAELRKAYELAHNKSALYTLPFDVPVADFDFEKEYPVQEWTRQYS
jgi:UDP-N-acetyl-alpha-D-muramoyl-L-alanyl-L-glutamate epimerase